MAEKQSQEKEQSQSFGAHAWRFFSSLRLALILMLALIALSLIGTFVIQVPAWATSDPNSYNQWLKYAAQPQTGFWYPILHFFDFFNVFHSVWFLGSGALLIVSIIICSLNRLRRTKINIAMNRVNRMEEFYKTENSETVLSSLSSPSETGEQVIQLLKKHRYSVIQENPSHGLYLAADKHRFIPLGTYAIHLSIILFITGYLIGSYLGFKDAAFIVPEGATQPIGYNTGLSLHLNSFTDEYWPNGSPKDYRSEVDIVENNQVVKRATVEVNHPLDYEGIRIYQSFFGPAVQINLTEVSGKELFKGDIALSGIEPDHPYQRPSGAVALSQDGYTLYIVGRATNLNDSVLNKGQIGFELYKRGSAAPLISTKLDRGVPYNLGNIQVTYLGDAQFSGFQISRDPGNSLIWIASGFFLLGLVLVFYFPRRRVWAFIESMPGKGNRLWLRTDSGHKPGAAIEFQSLIKEIRREIILRENNPSVHGE